MGEIKSLEAPSECPICRSVPQIENSPATDISWVGISIVRCCDLSIAADAEITAISHWNALCLGYRRALTAIPAADARAEALKEADGITPHDLFAATAPNDIPRDFMPRPLPFALPGFREGMGVSQQDRLAKEFDAKRAIAWRWHWADAMMERRANEGAK